MVVVINKWTRKYIFPKKKSLRNYMADIRTKLGKEMFVNVSTSYFKNNVVFEKRKPVGDFGASKSGDDVDESNDAVSIK